MLGSAFSLIFDVRCMTMRRWNLVLLRIIIVGIAKVALIPLFPDSDQRALLLFIYLAAPVAISGFIGVALLPADHRRAPPAPPDAGHRRAPPCATRLVNYLSTLAYQAPYFALPVIVLVNVDAATNSSFYVAWGIVAIAFYVPVGDRPGAARRRRQGRRPAADPGPPRHAPGRRADGRRHGGHVPRQGRGHRGLRRGVPATRRGSSRP